MNKKSDSINRRRTRTPPTTLNKENINMKINDSMVVDEKKSAAIIDSSSSSSSGGNDDDDNGGRRRSLKDVVMIQWKGRRDFFMAQGQIVVILAIAYIGNNWPHSYPRNDNHNLPMFWLMNSALALAGYLSIKHVESKNGVVTLLSRGQNEEWKGWMQWAFIMYHYYRAYPVYNEIRVFVSAYVWMTGFGNFMYFDKRQDFSIERCVGMWLRINYFPLMLSFFLNVPLELYYVVPLHTTGFFVALFTCLIATKLHTWRENSVGRSQSNFVTTTLLSTKWRCNAVAIAICIVAHLLFYETSMVDCLLWISTEIHFRFQADKYSVLVGIVSGFFWKDFSAMLQRIHGEEEEGNNEQQQKQNNNKKSNDDDEEQQKLLPSQSSDENNNNSSEEKNSSSATAVTTTVDETIKARKKKLIWIQRVGGVSLIGFWYAFFGSMNDKFRYNPIHPYVFWLPVAGYLMIRNSSKYLTECHSTVLEWIGKITLETYVLQFHVFMTKNVQHILVLLPGAGKDGNIVMKTFNMLLCGVGFVALSYWARKVTISTQMTVTELVTVVLKNNRRRKEQPQQKSSSSSGNDGDDNTTTTKSLLSSSGNDKEITATAAAAASDVEEAKKQEQQKQQQDQQGDNNADDNIGGGSHSGKE